MDLRQVRTVAITAVAADDVLMELLVLKGGNALEIVHGIGGRASLDLDYSVAGELVDLDDIGRRLERSLKDRFDAVGFEAFDFKFGRRPTTSLEGMKWGGYRAEFKVIEKEKLRRLSSLEALRRNAHAIGANQERTFCIDISKYEHTAGKILRRVSNFDCYVYSPDMILVEKLRAICQQMPGYVHRKNPSPRPRDFYDIDALLRSGLIDLDACGALLVPIFRAKDVPLALLDHVQETREFHEVGWESVKNAVSSKLAPFEDYFDSVLKLVAKLERIS
jgi:hypothetical protein